MHLQTNRCWSSAFVILLLNCMIYELYESQALVLSLYLFLPTDCQDSWSLACLPLPRLGGPAGTTPSTANAHRGMSQSHCAELMKWACEWVCACGGPPCGPCWLPQSAPAAPPGICSPPSGRSRWCSSIRRASAASTAPPGGPAGRRAPAHSDPSCPRDQPVNADEATYKGCVWFMQAMKCSVPCVHDD